MNAETYRHVPPEDQQAIREDYEREHAPSSPRTPDAAEAALEEEPPPEPEAAREPRPVPGPAAKPEPTPGPAPAPEPVPSPAPRQVYGVNAETYRHLPPEDQQAIREAWEAEHTDPRPDEGYARRPSLPPPPPQRYTPCSPLEPYHERLCIEHPEQVHHGGDPVLCVPGEGPSADSCRTVIVDEADDPAAAGAVWCYPMEGPYIGTRPCAPGEAPPPRGPAFEQAPTPSDDYQSWLDPARRGRERLERFDEALPTAREWDTGDFQGRDDGRLRFGLFIATEDSGIGPIRGEGDNRGFDPQFSPYATRAYLEVDFDSDRAYVVANPTCDPGGGCNDAKQIGDGALGDYSNEVTLEERDDGSIYVQYELANARLPGPLPGASIDGHITVRPKEDGTFDVRWFGDRYPSWEAYYDDACGTTWTLTPSEESRITDLLPWTSDRDFTIHVPVSRRREC